MGLCKQWVAQTGEPLEELLQTLGAGGARFVRDTAAAGFVGPATRAPRGGPLGRSKG